MRRTTTTNEQKRETEGNMSEVKIGDYNTLKVKELARREGYGEVFGLYLEGGREGDILMPQKYVPEGVKPGDEVRVFVYLDQEERPVATTEQPKAVVGEFAYLECTWVNEYGAFLDWGVTKNLFCPFREQRQRMRVGARYVVYIYIDEASYRIVASAKVERFLAGARREGQEPAKPPYKPGDEVELLVWLKTDLGFKVIIDNQYAGLLYDDQIFRRVHTGYHTKGYISQVRTDGKIDVALQRTGQAQTQSFADVLLKYLNDHDGTCNLGDKSEADDIYERFHVSKKVYKRAVGDLYKRRLITVGPMSIRLVDKAPH